MSARVSRAALAGALVMVVVLVGCGAGDKGKDAQKPPPVARPADFPKARGKTIQQLQREIGSGGPVLAPSGSIFAPGKNRLGFGLFDRARSQIADAAAAIYLVPIRSGKTVNGGKVQGPFLARYESLEVGRKFQSHTTASDPDSARSLYVSDVKFPKAGDYAVLGALRLDNRLVGTDLAGVKVVGHSPVPAVGDKAPRTDTPTTHSVGGHLSLIDTRDPHDTMHETNFADELGKKPQILLFATPALCQSRVCGPVVDIAEQVKSETGGKADFTHMEIYRDNEVEKGYRPQLQQWHLRSEPWMFAVNRKGRIVERIEGAFSPKELRAAVKRAGG